MFGNQKKKQEYRKLEREAEKRYGPELIPTYTDNQGTERWKGSGKRVHIKRSK